MQLGKHIYAEAIRRDTHERATDTRVMEDPLEVSSGEDDYDDENWEHMLSKLRISRQKKVEDGIQSGKLIEKEIQAFYDCRSCGQRTSNEDRCAVCKEKCTICDQVTEEEGTCKACRIDAIVKSRSEVQQQAGVFEA